MIDAGKHSLLDALSGIEDIDGNEEHDGKKDEADAKDKGGEAGELGNEPQAHAKGKENGTHASLDKSRDTLAPDRRKKAEDAIDKGNRANDDDEHHDEGIDREKIPDKAEDAHGNEGRGKDAFRPDDALVLHEAGDEIDDTAKKQGDPKDDVDDLAKRDRAAKKDADDKKDDPLDKKHRLLVGLERDRVFFLWHIIASFSLIL